MFPEFRDLITELKHHDAHFQKLFDEHNELDEKIQGLEKNAVAAGNRHDEIEQLKRQKLHLKDQLHQWLTKVASERAQS